MPSGFITVSLTRLAPLTRLFFARCGMIGRG